MCLVENRGPPLPVLEDKSRHEQDWKQSGKGSSSPTYVMSQLKHLLARRMFDYLPPPVGGWDSHRDCSLAPTERRQNMCITRPSVTAAGRKKGGTTTISDSGPLQRLEEVELGL